MTLSTPRALLLTALVVAAAFPSSQAINLACLSTSCATEANACTSDGECNTAFDCIQTALNTSGDCDDTCIDGCSSSISTSASDTLLSTLGECVIDCTVALFCDSLTNEADCVAGFCEWDGNSTCLPPPPPFDPTTCLSTSCTTETLACENDANCSTALTCILDAADNAGCDDACRSQCSLNTPPASLALLGDVDTCVNDCFLAFYCDSLATEADCQSGFCVWDGTTCLPPIAPPTSLLDPACLSTNCTAEAGACTSDTECNTALDCILAEVTNNGDCDDLCQLRCAAGLSSASEDTLEDLGNCVTVCTLDTFCATVSTESQCVAASCAWDGTTCVGPISIPSTLLDPACLTTHCVAEAATCQAEADCDTGLTCILDELASNNGECDDTCEEQCAGAVSPASLRLLENLGDCVGYCTLDQFCFGLLTESTCESTGACAWNGTDCALPAGFSFGAGSSSGSSSTTYIYAGAAGGVALVAAALAVAFKGSLFSSAGKAGGLVSA